MPEIIGLEQQAEIDLKLRQFLAGIPAAKLPIDDCLNQGGMVAEASPTLVGLECAADEIVAKIRVYFVERVGGCSCGDGPYEENGLCDLVLRVDRHTGVASWQTD